MSEAIERLRGNAVMLREVADQYARALSATFSGAPPTRDPYYDAVADFAEGVIEILSAKADPDTC